MFQKASRKQKKARIALCGPSGAGKTLTALKMAQGLGKTIACIDTEHGSSELYADQVEFDVCQLTDFHPARYIEAIEAAREYDVLIIDSFSHAWFGKNGELELAGGKFTGWKDVRPLERRLIDAILASPAHIIATMRSKTEYVVQENDRGKPTPTKVGTAPIQSAGIEFEFDIVGEIDSTHTLQITKSRCQDIADQQYFQPGETLGQMIKDWLEKGESFNASDYKFVETQTIVDWGYTKDVTCLTSDSIKTFCDQKGFPREPDKLTPDQALVIRNECFIHAGQNSGAFKAVAHARNAFNKCDIGQLSDRDCWQKWEAEIMSRKRSSTKTPATATA